MPWMLMSLVSSILSTPSAPSTPMSSALTFFFLTLEFFYIKGVITY